MSVQESMIRSDTSRVLGAVRCCHLTLSSEAIDAMEIIERKLSATIETVWPLQLWTLFSIKSRTWSNSCGDCRQRTSRVFRLRCSPLRCGGARLSCEPWRNLLMCWLSWSQGYMSHFSKIWRNPKENRRLMNKLRGRHQWTAIGQASNLICATRCADIL